MPSSWAPSLSIPTTHVGIISWGMVGCVHRAGVIEGKWQCCSCGGGVGLGKMDMASRCWPGSHRKRMPQQAARLLHLSPGEDAAAAAGTGACIKVRGEGGGSCGGPHSKALAARSTQVREDQREASGCCGPCNARLSPLGVGGALRVLGRLRGEVLGSGSGGAAPLGDGPHLHRVGRGVKTKAGKAAHKPAAKSSPRAATD